MTGATVHAETRSTSRTATATAAWVFVGSFGLFAAALGFAVFLPHALLANARVIDVVGTVVGLAGLALVVFAFRAVLTGRRKRTKLLAIPATLVLIQWFLVPVIGGGLAVNTTHPHIQSATTLGLPGARDVSFPARDGTRLQGWYAPGRNGGAVILMHGSHGTRASTESHLRMLARTGYAVLAYDARGHGASG